ncbi:MAG: alpha/beta fold hydrolase, partial [Elusimicrobia bacterium]|nr:alpha/beta fold hydrolase [Elusimicrobiota bacterium]
MVKKALFLASVLAASFSSVSIISAAGFSPSPSIRPAYLFSPAPQAFGAVLECLHATPLGQKYLKGRFWTSLHQRGPGNWANTTAPLYDYLSRHPVLPSRFLEPLNAIASLPEKEQPRAVKQLVDSLSEDENRQVLSAFVQAHRQVTPIVQWKAARLAEAVNSIPFHLQRSYLLLIQLEDLTIYGREVEESFRVIKKQYTKSISHSLGKSMDPDQTLSGSAGLSSVLEVSGKERASVAGATAEPISLPDSSGRSQGHPMLWQRVWALWERSQLYKPVRQITSCPLQFQMSYEDVFFQTADGVRLNGWYIPSADPKNKETILVFHGNGENISGHIEDLKLWHDLGLNVFVFDYRGYGKSRGKPSEQGIYQDALAAYQYVVEEKRIPPEKMILFGGSLGGAVAIDLATRVKAGALITYNTFTSVVDMGKKLFPFLPVERLITQRYESIKKVPGLKIPWLILHGRGDRYVPLSHAEKLFGAAPEPKEMVVLSTTHLGSIADDAPLGGPHIRSFLKKHLSSYRDPIPLLQRENSPQVVFLEENDSIPAAMPKRKVWPWNKRLSRELVSSVDLNVEHQAGKIEPTRSGTFQFALLADSGASGSWWGRLLSPNRGFFRRVLSAVRQHPIQFSIHIGDQTPKGTLRCYGLLLEELKRSVRWAYLAVIGNHDRSRNQRGEDNLFKFLFGRTNYYFDYEGFRFVFLDTSTNKLSSLQLDWLDKVLDTSLKKLIFTHSPPSVLKDAQIQFWGTPYPRRSAKYLFETLGFKQGSQAFVEVLSRRGVERVYSGHIHSLLLLSYQGVQYVVAGSSGSPPYPFPLRNSLTGFILVRISPQGIEETEHTLEGQVIRLSSLWNS